MGRRRPIHWPAEVTAEFDYVDYLDIAEELAKDSGEYDTEVSDDDQGD